MAIFALSLFRRCWVTRIGFVLGEGRDALWVDGVTWVSTSDIPTIFQSLELVIKQGKPLEKSDRRPPHGGGSPHLR
jgi:hypothetical protein